MVVPSAKLPRRGSIDGAPEIVEVITDEEEGMTVDLRDYISMESDDDVSHVSSSQKTADERQDLLSPPRDSQPPDVEETEGNTSQSVLTSGRNLPQLVIDEDDLPSWMHKKSQWKYVASTAGGAEWENLLKVYMHQERRLEFTETVSNLPHILVIPSPEPFAGHSFTNGGSATEDKRVLPVCSPAVAR